MHVTRSLAFLALTWILMGMLALAGGAAPPTEGPGISGDPVQNYRPGTENPLTNPARSEFFPDHELTMLSANPPRFGGTVWRSWNGTTDTATLTDWQNEGFLSSTWSQYSAVNHNEGSAFFPEAPLAADAGRINSSTADEIVCAFYTYKAGDPAMGVTVMLHPDQASPVSQTFHPGSPQTPDDAFPCLEVAVADMDRRVEADGLYHDEIVVASKAAAADGHWYVTVTVLNRNLQVLAQERTVYPLLSVHDAQDRASFAMTAGDYDNDGRAEIAVVQDDGTGFEDMRTVALTTLSLETDGNRENPVLTRKGTVVVNGVQTSGELARWWSPVYDAASGDFDGTGSDEIAVSVAAASNFQGKIEVFRTDLNLVPTLHSTFTTPGPTSSVSVASGLFKYDPNNNYGTARRQLAATWQQGDDLYGILALFDLDLNLNLTQRGTAHYQPPLAERMVDSLLAVPQIAAGSFLGLDSTTPHSDLAVSFAMCSTNGLGPDTLPPMFAIFEVSNDMVPTVKGYRYQEGTTGSSQVALAQAAITNLPLVAADRTGDGYFLGSPVHIEIPQIIRSTYVIQEPPKHMDLLPGDSGGLSVVNVSRNDHLYVQLKDSSNQTLSTSQGDHSSHENGSSESTTASESVSVKGPMQMFKATETGTWTHGTTFDYKSTTEQETSHYETLTYNFLSQTNQDDYVQAQVKVIDVWRYPVFGLKDEGLQGFYEVFLPGPSEVLKEGPGTANGDWYVPFHENGNALSYPVMTSANSMPDMGTFLIGDQPYTQALSKNVETVLGGNQGSLEIQWSSTVGSMESTSWEQTSTESADVRMGLVANCTSKFVDAEASYTTEWGWHESDSTGETTYSKATTTQSKGITVNVPPGAFLSDRCYSFKPIVYITKDGTMKVAHTVNTAGSYTGSPWWDKIYGKTPDPALNLPMKFFANPTSGEWEAGATRQDRSRLRGLFLMHQYAATEDQRDYLAQAPVAGDQVCVLARVYNYAVTPVGSLAGPSTGPFTVRFSYAPYNPDLGDAEPQLTTIGEYRMESLAPRQMGEAWVNWDTTGLGGSVPGTPRSYVIYVTIDPDNELTTETHELRRPDGSFALDGNNQGYWPWNNSFRIYSPQTASAEAADPLALGLDPRLLLEHTQQSVRQYHPHYPHEHGLFLPQVGLPYLLKATVHANRSDRVFRLMRFYLDGELVSLQRSYGLQEGANDFHFRWTPRHPGLRLLQLRVAEPEGDTSPGDALAQARLAVVPVGGGQGVGGGPDSAGGGGGFCFVATAAYGSYQEPHVQVLRTFRDRYLLTHRPGTWLTGLYYRTSPPLAAYIAERPWARSLARLCLAPVYGGAWMAVEHGPASLLLLLLTGAGLATRLRRRR